MRKEFRILSGIFMYLILAAFAAASDWGLFAAEPGDRPTGVFFSESFNDSQLINRGGYDGKSFTISRDGARSGAGCIEYRWNRAATTPSSSSGVRRLFEPSDTIYLRFYMRLSQGWGWSGRQYHPHLINFLT